MLGQELCKDFSNKRLFDFIMLYCNNRCLLIAIFGGFGNLLTIFAIPWAWRKKILVFELPHLKFTSVFIVNLAFAIDS